MTLGRLVRGMAQRGHTVQVVRPRQRHDDHGGVDGLVEEVPVAGLPLPRYDGLHFGLPARGKLRTMWRARRPDVVHIATEGPLGITALWAARDLKLPVSSSFHTNFHQYGSHYGYGFLHRWVMGYLRHVHNRADCTMVPARDVKQTLEADGFKGVMVLARGVDGELFSPAKRDAKLRAEWGAAPDDPVVVYVGRIAGEKNIPLAVRAFEAMKRVDSRAKLVLVGDGPARAGIQKQHPDYIFAGMRRGEDLARHYASGDLFVFASVTETFGNVVTEAMASGLCVLTYDYAAGRQYIEHGVNGFLAKFNDDADFVRVAEGMMRDLPACRRAAVAARSAAEAITWDAIFDTFEGKLAELAGVGAAVTNAV